jgi:MFS family permease
VPGPATPAFNASDQRAVLATLAVAALMVMYVETMIVPAIPRFIVFFGASLSLVAWILTAYLLVGVVATPIIAKLGDIYGKKRVLLAVLAVYAAAVSVAGFTPEISTALGISRTDAIYVLIGVRGIQGVGIGMFPLAFALVGEVFPPDRIAVAQGTIASMFAVGAALGLVGGAWITETFGWQTTYHSIVPLAILAPIIVYVVLRESRHLHDVPLDVPGAVLLGGALGTFLVGLSEGPTWGWGAWGALSLGGIPFGTPEFLLLAAILFVGFLIWEPRSPNPIVDFARLKQRNVALANVSGITSAASMFVFFVGSQTILQVPTAANGLGLNTFDAGLASVPCSIAMLALGPVMGRAVSTRGPRPVMIVGGGLILLGGLLFAFLNRTVLEVTLDAVPLLLGVIACFIAMTNIVVVSSRPQEKGIQIGMNQTFRNIGSAIGPVVASTILSSFTASVVVGSYIIPGSGGQVGLVTKSFPDLDAYRYAFLAVAAMGALTALMAALLENYRYLADGTRVGSAAPPAEPAVRRPGPTVEAPAASHP